MKAASIAKKKFYERWEKIESQNKIKKKCSDKRTLEAEAVEVIFIVMNLMIVDSDVACESRVLCVLENAIKQAFIAWKSSRRD